MGTLPKLTKLENRKEYKEFNQFLDAANNRTKEADNQRKNYQTYVNLVVNGLMKKFRGSNKLFGKMYASQIVSGNYFDCPADLDYDENDCNIILKLPFGDSKSIKVEQSNKKRGYCRLRVNGNPWEHHFNDPLVQEFREKFMHKDNFLRVNGFSAWFEQIFNEYFIESGGSKNQYEMEIVQKTETLKLTISKPVKSVTGLYIKVHVPSKNVQFSIAFSLGMEFDSSYSQYRSKFPMSIDNPKWVAIAKPDKTTVIDDIDWLCSFYTIERKMLQDKSKPVPLIRIFKNFFNAAIIPNLNTYLLENIFFGEIVKQDNARQTNFWQSSFASLFLHMFNVILASLDAKSVPYFWDNTVNLAESVNHKKIYNKLVQQKTLLENRINSTESNITFDDLFFKIGTGDSKQSSQSIQRSNSLTSSVTCVANEFLAYLGMMKKNDVCRSNKNVSTITSTPLKPTIPANGSANIQQNMTSSSRSTPSSSRSPNLSSSFSTLSIDSHCRKTKSVNATLILQLLSKFIQIKERKEYTTHYNAVLEFFVNELKQDEVFNKMSRGHVMGGSYTDDLKVSKPNEFDTLLNFSFGVDKTKIQVKKCKSNKSGYCNINLKQCDLNDKSHLKKFLDENGYVLQDEILKWMQRLFAQILQKHNHNNNTIRINNHSYKYKHSRNGPAFTFAIQVLNTDIEFDMDLVPAFPFDENNWLATRELPKDKNQINWIAVPKPPKTGITNKNPSFICSYTALEKTYLHGANNAKNLIRLFKKLRDTNNLTSLKSYFIKTIFLWQFHNTKVSDRNAFWSQSLDVLFIKMFKIILDHIERRELLFFWDNKYNMFGTIQPSVLKSMRERLGGLLSNVDSNLKDNKNPEYLIDIILTKVEKDKFLQEYGDKLNRD